jgi:hypothetical protein
MYFPDLSSIQRTTANDAYASGRGVKVFSEGVAYAHPRCGWRIGEDGRLIVEIDQLGVVACYNVWERVQAWGNDDLSPILDLPEEVTD